LEARGPCRVAKKRRERVGGISIEEGAGNGEKEKKKRNLPKVWLDSRWITQEVGGLCSAGRDDCALA